MDKSEHCKEVYAYYGLAMYRAQCVEQSIIQLLIFFDFFKSKVPEFKSVEKWTEDFDGFERNVSSKTMGRLVGYLDGLGVINDDVLLNLKDALKKRNNLAHAFYVENALNFVSEDGRNKMISFLQEHIDIFNTVENLLEPISSSLREKYGLTDEVLKYHEEMLYAEANGDL